MSNKETSKPSQASTPKASTPKASTPKASTPKASTPKASTPKASTPKASAPKASAPKASAPKASKPQVVFTDLGLPDALLKAVLEQGYEEPTPIQAEAIPPLLEGRDLLGQAQTGTGKTAAFALPLLSLIDTSKKATQLLILAPTRELAIQVAEACQQYAKHINGLNILPIYGGQSYTIQLKQLNRGAQVVVGTPGRVMDHMRRKTLSLDKLQALVLDEADEMLRMGFIDDVKWVLEQSPPDRQIALFSATMPREVKRVADQHLQNPVHIKIASKTVTADNTSQRYWIVRGTNKLDAITRILESEETDGVIVFVRTKNATVELADKLAARGFRSEALNGDVVQATREKIVDRLKKGKLDILVATDVVARGLDVERISHVINYDIPHDTESYIHRIGRTGRAGRSGKAIIFIAPREKRMLGSIERATKQKIEPMELPTVQDINLSRRQRFKDKITDVVANSNLDFFSQIVAELQQEKEISSEQIAAAASLLAQGDTPLIFEAREVKKYKESDRDDFRESRRESSFSSKRKDRKAVPNIQATPLKDYPDVEMQRFQLDVGRNNRVNPGNIVGAIANEAELESKYIGEIEIRDDYSTVDLPADMPKEVMAILRKARVAGRELNIEVYKKPGGSGKSHGDKKHGGKSDSAKRSPRRESDSGDAGSSRKSYKSRKPKIDSGGQKTHKPKSDYAKKKREERKK